MASEIDALVVQQRITNRLLMRLIFGSRSPPQHQIIEMLEGIGASNAELAILFGTTGPAIAVTRKRIAKGKSHEPKTPETPEVDANQVLGASPQGQGDSGEQR